MMLEVTGVISFHVTESSSKKSEDNYLVWSRGSVYNTMKFGALVYQILYSNIRHPVI